jgi:AbrB family looped-hinge helix DNA binding protein
MVKEIVTTISQAGRITLPAEVQRLLGVKPRDRVAFVLEDQQVRLVRVRYTLESVGASVEPATATEHFEQIVKDAKAERAQRRARRRQQG